MHGVDGESKNGQGDGQEVDSHRAASGEAAHRGGGVPRQHVPEPHAAIALAQLRRLDEFVAHRRRIAARSDAALVDGPVTPLAIPSNSFCNYYKYVAFLPPGADRTTVKKRLREEYEVGLSGEVYEQPLHLQSVFAPFADGPLPGAEELCARHICLPVSAVMTDEQADLVVESLQSVLVP